MSAARPVKVCALPWRRGARGIEILAFRHPLAGLQLVKGSLDPGEDPAEGARRELAEESGVETPVPGEFWGDAEIGEPPVSWRFFGFEIGGLPDNWTYRTQDDGGHDFAFFWHPLGAEPSAEWHESFLQALCAIRSLR